MESTGCSRSRAAKFNIATEIKGKDLDQMNVQTEGWMDGWIDGWTDDEQIDGRVDGWTDDV